MQSLQCLNSVNWHFVQHEVLTQCILVDSSTIVSWTGPFVILGVSGIFCRLHSVFDGNAVSKQYRP